ncbi:uncharacterized protein LOC116412226 [Xenopus tropicalis]|uniref:Uncharacterized protein LOC116412226 n=1 Tax=Xenopus tropicalis TaxID=8364 RepID=A0A8J1JVB6_XENTR|nr:uncharacterized protein LOC116412226 [Xenopus tropicalis]
MSECQLRSSSFERIFVIERVEETTRDKVDGFIDNNDELATEELEPKYKREFRRKTIHMVTRSQNGSLPSPKIHLNPLRPMYTGGEQVTVRCEPPNSKEVQKIQFYKDGIVIDRDKDLHRDDSYTVSMYGHEAAGDFSCAYWVKIQERDLKSNISEKVTIKTEGFTTPLSTTLTSTVTEAKTSKDPISTTTRLTTEHLHADNISTLAVQELIYTIGGAGLFILVVTISLVLLRTCRKGKSKYHEPAPFPVQANNSASNLRLHQINASVPDSENESTWPQNAVSLQDNEDAAQIHTYCEIDPFLPTLPAMRSTSPSVQLPQSSALAYSTVQAVPLLPTVYQRNLQPNH